MSVSRFKREFAVCLAHAFQQLYSAKYAEAGEKQVFSADFIFNNLEKPKDAAHGRFAFPVFRYSGLLGEKPQDIAAKAARAATQAIASDDSFSGLIGCDSVSGFVNAKTNFELEANETLTAILHLQTGYGSSDEGGGQTVLVEYSSPNIAKPFGIGHLRTTILGNALRRVFNKLGYQAVGINYLGDWGTQFGKMVVAYRLWGSEKPGENENVSDLLELYVRFHQEAEKDESLDEQAREAFKKLEDSDPETTALWQRFRDISVAEFKRVYDFMGVEFDWITGEAFLNDKMEPVIERLTGAGLTSVSEGALIVDLNDPQLPPCLLKKADGATLYATRDIAGLLYRWDRYRFQQAIYVVGSAQSDHFKQVFKVVELLEDAENTPPDQKISGRAKHVEFGWVKFGDKTMATRRGEIILLGDVIAKAVDLARQKIIEKNPDLKNIDETAQMIGVGAVLFSQLSVRRQKDVNFAWEEVLNFEGETGPYLQYTHARLCSLLRNYNAAISPEVDFSVLDAEEERRVVELMADFPDAVKDAAGNYEPNHISVHLLKLATAFNKVYQRKDRQGKIDKIISEDAGRSAARMALVKSVQLVIREGLYLLGLKAPEEM